MVLTLQESTDGPSWGVHGTSSETRGKDSGPAYEAVADEEDQVGSQNHEGKVFCLLSETNIPKGPEYEKISTLIKIAAFAHANLRCSI